MSNLLTAGLAYNPYFYAQEGLRILYKRLGMAYYVKRDLGAGKGSGTGDTIQVRRPQTFTAASMPIAEASFADVSPTYDNLVINQWQGQGFKLTDKEKTLTPAKFVSEHIAPVANSIADAIDQDIAALSLLTPWIVSADATNPYKDFTACQAQFLNNKAPMVDPADYSYMVGANLMQAYLNTPTFLQANTAGDGGAQQRSGALGQKLGFNIFANQNTRSYTSGTGALTSPVTTASAGATTINITGTSGSGTLKKGTVLTITGDSQKYVVTADSAVAAGGTTATAISPVLAQAATAAVVAFDQTAATEYGVAFHRDAIALVMQPLEDAGPGIFTATVTEPTTGLTLRSRVWGSGGLGATLWSLDALWGTKVLNPNLMIRVRY